MNDLEREAKRLNEQILEKAKMQRLEQEDEIKVCWLWFLENLSVRQMNSAFERVDAQCQVSCHSRCTNLGERRDKGINV